MAQKTKFQTPTGMRDILGDEEKYFKKIYKVVEDIADFYAFQKITTPVMEDIEVFNKGTGEATDVVKKEMFSLKTKGGDSLCLRPEGTPAVARAFIENGMSNWPQPVKLWYFEPFFRYEHPQSGRYREFWQFGFEVFGEKNSIVDAQIIQIFCDIFKELKIKDILVEVNSMGDSNCRPYYKKLLTNYFKSRESSLCADCKRRLKENPLRILDCKEEKCQPIKAEAPQVLDHLCEECRLHFKEVLEYLDELEIPYRLNPYLVRGLDYYTKTVFEVFGSLSEGEGDAEKKQLALAGGGRYDKLIKLLGGRDIPAIGAAGGVDRIAMLMKKQDVKLPEALPPQIFIAQLGNLAKRKSLKLLNELWKANIRVAESFGRDSLKAQLARADKLGAKLTLILGQKEALEGTIIIRDMESGKQSNAKLDKAVQEVREMLKK